jgi:hypothetical protein
MPSTARHASLPKSSSSIIRGLGARSNFTIGLLSAVPYIGAVIGMILVGRHSDCTLEAMSGSLRVFVPLW